mmetsp:Transcript_2055/g.2971  ORF Transcript_2055/g.2971 Transcript_2055/m.2971 type:complete len:224 (+) Transcript_2055:49-720(+)
MLARRKFAFVSATLFNRIPKRKFNSSFQLKSEADEGLSETVRKGLEELKKAMPSGGKGKYMNRPLEEAKSDKNAKSVRQLAKEEQYYQALIEFFEDQFEEGSNVTYSGMLVEVVTVSISPDLAELTVFWGLANERSSNIDKDIAKLLLTATAANLTDIEAKIILMIEKRLKAHSGYIRSILASKVNSKRVPHLLFRHFSEKDPITRAAYKNFRYQEPKTRRKK